MKLFTVLFCISLPFSIFASKVTYLGVYATPLKREVSHQLALPANLHLSVEHVEKGSPAEKAGIQKFDILLHLDDQILVNPEQLKFLVRSKEKGDEVELHYLRQGKKRKLLLELGDIEPKNENIERSANQMPRSFDRNRLDLDRFFKNDPDLNRFFTMPRDPFMQNRGSFFRHSMPEDLDDDPIHPNTDIQSFSHESTQSQIMVTDEKGTLELNETDGKKYLRATDSKGRVIFDGPINTEEDRNKLGKDLRKRVQDLEKKVNR